ncbi:hypothetical protein TrRE_jg4378 [Triparma retinervis]|uniref:Uncharacterized protein n=1 Tax=Triparma retinervis TaxID=2557542 RepID=A0A9W6ZLB8_9STRA|nr:hypothetical protein TrRE_jg4378 [Triparma retinervis]
MVETRETTMGYFVFFTAVIVYLYVMKNYFNTVVPTRALREERERNKMEDRYHEAHQRREHFVQHLAWAKSRKAGNEEVTRLQKCVEKTDAEIDDLEEQVNHLYKEHGVSAR